MWRNLKLQEEVTERGSLVRSDGDSLRKIDCRSIWRDTSKEYQSNRYHRWRCHFAPNYCPLVDYLVCQYAITFVYCLFRIFHTTECLNFQTTRTIKIMTFLAFQIFSKLALFVWNFIFIVSYKVQNWDRISVKCVILSYEQVTFVISYCFPYVTRNLIQCSCAFVLFEMLQLIVFRLIKICHNKKLCKITSKILDWKQKEKFKLMKKSVCFSFFAKC